MNLCDKLLDLHPNQREKYLLDPRSRLLGLILFCLTALFLEAVPILYLYLFIPLGTLVYLIPDVLSCKGAPIAALLLILPCGLLYWWGKTRIPSNPEAMATARAILRIFIFVASSLVFLLTISLSRFIRALEKMHVPFSLIFVLTMAIRFFPLMLREMELIRDNARSKGMGWDQWILHPCQCGRAFLFPLLIRSLKKADALALAAATRGFGAPVQRTSRQNLKMRSQDGLFLMALLLLFLFFLCLDYWIPMRWG